MKETSHQRVAVVGVGGIGSVHALTVSQLESAELTAVVDASASRAQEVGERFHVPFFTSVDTLLAGATIDAAIIAVPDTAHAAVTRQILGAGVPVMLEKPMASSTAEALDLAWFAERQRTRLFVGHTLRFDPRYAAAFEALRAGEIGRPLHFLAGRWAISSRRDLVRLTSSAPFDLGVHDIDAVQWVTGQKILEVCAYGVTEDDGGPSRSVVAICRLDGGAVGQIFCGWTRLDSSPSPLDSRFEVVGTEGVVTVRVHDDGGVVLAASKHLLVDATYGPVVRGVIGGTALQTVRHFLSCLSSSTEFEVSLRDAVSAVSVAEAINRSVASGRPEQVEQVYELSEP